MYFFRIFFFISLGIMMRDPFNARLSFLLSSSLNDQYGFRCNGISFCLSGQPATIMSLSAAISRSLLDFFCQSFELVTEMYVLNSKILVNCLWLFFFTESDHLQAASLFSRLVYNCLVTLNLKKRTLQSRRCSLQCTFNMIYL